MVVLDTDILSLIQDEANPVGQRVLARLRASSRPNAITSPTVEEQLKGRLAYCAGAKTVEQYVEAVRQLLATLDLLRERTVLRFDDRAAAEFKQLKVAKIRIGTMDLRIASIALVYGATLVTANVSDFRKVPGLAVEDWTKPDLGS